MKLSQVQYRKCPRCAKFGIKTWFPLADAVYEGTRKDVHNGKFKFKDYKVCKPCERNVKAYENRKKINPKSIERHWKLNDNKR